MIRQLALALGVIVTMVVALLIAQPLPQAPVFRAGTDYVRVDVVVTDKSDRSITDLAKQDFTIEEGGRPQKIEDFQFVSVPLQHRPLDRASMAASPDVATNTPASPLSRLFVMAIDDLHILEQDVSSVKRIMVEFIRALSPDDEAAIIFVSHSNLGQNFTSDARLLMRTVDHVSDALGFGLDALGRSTGSNVVYNDVKYICACARSADLAIRNITASLAGSAHPRRAIVYVTDGSIVGTPAKLCDFDEQLALYEEARRADVPIYTIDPRGQVLPDEAVRGGISAVGNIDGTVGELQRAHIVENIRHQQDRLVADAINTGGRAFTNQSDLTRAVDEIVSENGSYYLLGYYPMPFAADGKFHDFSVTVNRPAARVRARQGYVASKAAPGNSDPGTVLDTAMNAGVNVSGIALRAFAAPISPTAKGMTTIVTVEVTYPARPGDALDVDDELQLKLVALDPDAKIRASSSKVLRFKARMQTGRPTTFLIDDAVDLPAQPLTLRVAVASRALRKAGSIQMPVDLPKPSTDKLQLSGVVLGVDSSPADATMDSGAIAALVPFQPTTRRIFAIGETLRVFARAFFGMKERTVTASVDVPGTPLQATIVTLGASPAARGRQQATLDTTLPLVGLAPGRYSLRVEVRSANEQSVNKVVAFEVR